MTRRTENRLRNLGKTILVIYFVGIPITFIYSAIQPGQMFQEGSGMNARSDLWFFWVCSPFFVFIALLVVCIVGAAFIGAWEALDGPSQEEREEDLEREIERLDEKLEALRADD